MAPAAAHCTTGGLAVVRPRVKKAFKENAQLTDEEEIVRAVAKGRWFVNNEMVGVIKLKKYRTMKARYYDQ